MEKRQQQQSRPAALDAIGNPGMDPRLLKSAETMLRFLSH
jgi:hypothetical protein